MNIGEGMAAAAVRIVVRDIMTQTATARKGNSSSSSSYVHPIAYDLHIITGHALNREGKDSSIVQETVIGMLKQLNIDCYINPNNKGRVVVSSSNLQQYQRNNAV
jgi:hypothetical protein